MADTESMLTITYASTAVEPFSDEALLDLLAQSRDTNLKFHVTGLLLYKDGNFMQAIEGPKAAITQLYANIRGDGRHRNVITLIEAPVSERAFGGWSMAFKNLGDAGAVQVPGYSEFLTMPLSDVTFREKPSQAQKLLLMFREKMR